MDRREFSLGAARLLGASALGLPAAALAQGVPEEGTHYRQLDKRVAVEAPAGKIEVVEFFWYRCPHCNAFEPKLVSWIKRLPPDVVVRRVPVAFRDDFVPQQRLFYTLEAMGKLDELHPKVFEAIHVHGDPTDRGERILGFVQKHGLDRARFVELYNSRAISDKARAATLLQEAYRVEGVPALGIAGRYYVDGETAGTMDRALRIADYLIAEARKAK